MEALWVNGVNNEKALIKSFDILSRKFTPLVEEPKYYHHQNRMLGSNAVKVVVRTKEDQI